MSKVSEKRSIIILAKALEKAFNSVGCDLRCFDWLSYRPDYWIKKERNNGKKISNHSKNY